MSIVLNYVQQLKPYRLLTIPTDKVPRKFKEGLIAKCADATPEQWVKNSKGMHGAYYMYKVWPKFALMDENGDWVETFVYSVTNNIKDEVRARINTLHRKYVLDRILTSIHRDTGRSYFVFIQTNDGDYILNINENGDLLQRMSYSRHELEDDLDGIATVASENGDMEDNDDEVIEEVKLDETEMEMAED